MYAVNVMFSLPRAIILKGIVIIKLLFYLKADLKKKSFDQSNRMAYFDCTKRKHEYFCSTKKKMRWQCLRSEKVAYHQDSVYLSRATTLIKSQWIQDKDSCRLCQCYRVHYRLKVSFYLLWSWKILAKIM